MTTATSTADCLDSEHALYESPAGVLDAPLAFVWPLAGPFGALLLSAMAWLSIG